MTSSVSHRAIGTFGLIGSLLVLWAVLVIPGAPWTASVALAALAVLVGAAGVLWLDRRSPVPVTPSRVPRNGKS